MASMTPAAVDWQIEPRSPSLGARARDVWAHRRLFRYFAVRAMQRLYQGTVLGKVWLFLRSPIPTALQAMIFGGVLGIQAPGGLPYFLFLFTGTCVWQLFSNGLMWATRSFQINRAFLGKLYFPRLILPAATMSIAFVYFAIMAVMLALTFVYFYVSEGKVYLAPIGQMWWALLGLFNAVGLAFAVGLFTSVLNAEYRDVRFTLRYVLEFWALLTPIIYPVTAVPEQWRWLVYINPMTSAVQAFKWGILGVEPVSPWPVLANTLTVIVILLLGLLYFGKAEGQAVDRI
jgi:lipopolysaccharide transport system permease protein